MDEPAIESAINLCRAMGNDKAADEITNLRSQLEEAKRERDKVFQYWQIAEGRADAAQAELAELKHGEPVGWWNGKETAFFEHETDGPVGEVSIPLYPAPPTANQIRAQAFEDAAGMCETTWNGDADTYDWSEGRNDCAEQLRAEAKKLREL